jgi:hypothetical protein
VGAPVDHDHELSEFSGQSKSAMILLGRYLAKEFGTEGLVAMSLDVSLFLPNDRYDTLQVGTDRSSLEGSPPRYRSTGPRRP